MGDRSLARALGAERCTTDPIYSKLPLVHFEAKLCTFRTTVLPAVVTSRPKTAQDGPEGTAPFGAAWRPGISQPRARSRYR